MRLVIKTGSAVLSKPKGGLDRSAINRISSQLSRAQRLGHQVVLVTSGAISAGVARLGWKERPRDLRSKQTAAAVGQLALMEAYEEALSKSRIVPAQLLVTREDLMNKERGLNIRNTLLHLLSLKTIPIINENDSVSTEEIKFGDNDTLAATVATKIDADKLILLSDVPGMFDQDNKGNLTRRVIPAVEKITIQMERRAHRSTGSSMSVGGIVTKLRAAKMATSKGIETWLASGYNPTAILKILERRHDAGTRFIARKKK